MASPKLRFYFREPTIDTNLPITDGTVKIEDFDWESVSDEEAAGARDCGFAARVRAHAQGLAPSGTDCMSYFHSEAAALPGA